MIYDVLTVQEIGNSKLLIYKDDFNHLNFTLKLPNILTFVRTNFLNTPLCYFDISDKMALSDLQRFAMSKANILKILKTAIDVINACSKQGIALEHILFDANYVFVDSSYSPHFAPLSISGNTLKEVKQFLKSIITDSVIEPAADDSFVQTLLNCFNDSQFTFDKLRQIVDGLLNLHGSTVPFPMAPPFQSPQFAYQPPQQQDDYLLGEFLKNQISPNQFTPQPIDNLPNNQPISNSVNSGFAPNVKSSEEISKEKLTDYQKIFNPETPQKPLYPTTGDYPEKLQPQPASLHSFFEDSGTLPKSFQSNRDGDLPLPSSPPEIAALPPPIPPQVSAVPSQLAYLIYAEKPDSYIELNKTPYRIGRHPDMADYIINSPYIGRIHAHIEASGGKFYLFDDDSTNGTFLNGAKISKNTPHELASDDMIQFAKYPFKFIIK